MCIRDSSGAAVSCAGPQDGKLNHPAGVIPKPLYGEHVVSFQLAGDVYKRQAVHYKSEWPQFFHLLRRKSSQTE